MVVSLLTNPAHIGPHSPETGFNPMQTRNTAAGWTDPIRFCSGWGATVICSAQ